MLLPGLPRSDAEEALADVFISLWRSAKQVPEGAVRPYIAAMARNRARDALRARHAELPLEEAELEIPGRSPEQALTESETRERTRRRWTPWESPTGRYSCGTTITSRAWRT